jgi:hypothetical protein
VPRRSAPGEDRSIYSTVVRVMVATPTHGTRSGECMHLLAQKVEVTRNVLIGGRLPRLWRFQSREVLSVQGLITEVRAFSIATLDRQRLPIEFPNRYIWRWSGRYGLVRSGAD